MSDTISLQNSLIRGLACAALYDGLRSVLLIDANPTQLNLCADLLSEMLAVLNGGTAVSPITLTSAATDDMLWGVPFIPDQHGNNRFLQRGILTDAMPGRPPTVITSSDLSQLNLATQRAAVMYLAAPVVHLERHGQQRYWEPNHCWLVSCAQQDMGKLSPHLLDRFLIRLTVSGWSLNAESSKVDKLLAKLTFHNKSADANAYLTPSLPAEFAAMLQQAAKHFPQWSHSNTEHVLTYVASTGLHYSLRRDIALARLSVVHAMLAKRDQVTEGDIEAAAEVMGYQRERDKTTFQSQHREESKQEDNRPDINRTIRPTADPISSTPPEARSTSRQDLTETLVFVSDSQAIMPAMPLPTLSAEPYAEDRLPPDREATSLRLLFRINGLYTQRRGPIVGVTQATDVSDLALVSTLFEAIKFQQVRRQFESEHPSYLSLYPSDLRTYRRLPFAESLLVLVIDYTSLRHCDWETALLPHLEWAYTSRASVSLIRIGAANATHELRAEPIVASSLLDPRFSSALITTPGRATPLAHGLELAHQSLRHALQHGRAAHLQARLVIVSDGRGNVPIEASHTGIITIPVNREGIDDALQIAVQLSRLERLTIIFLDPQPSQHSELPQFLADSLGATVQPIPRLHDQQPDIVQKHEMLHDMPQSDSQRQKPTSGGIE
ncbi:MAG: hypothetical protein U0175_26605 [Caldilineaceae bacterium]